jgi:hypothetical protein
LGQLSKCVFMPENMHFPNAIFFAPVFLFFPLVTVNCALFDIYKKNVSSCPGATC